MIVKPNVSPTVIFPVPTVVARTEAAALGAADTTVMKGVNGLHSSLSPLCNTDTEYTPATCISAVTLTTPSTGAAVVPVDVSPDSVCVNWTYKL